MTDAASSEEPVIVAVHRIEFELLRDVQDACAKAHARYVPWTGEVGLPSLRRTPSVLVTGLRVGERRIPDDVLDLATNAYPDLSLLVLCREPLLRPTMSLNNGRITLVSPPLTSPRVASALRSLLTDRHVGYASTDTAPGLLGNKAPISVRRYRRSNCSVGVVASGADAGAPAPRPPVVRHTKTEGLTVLLARPGIVAEPMVNVVAQALARPKPDADRAAELVEILGDRAALLHLDAAAEEWGIYWPHADWPLILASPLRLPNVWNMARTIERLRHRYLRVHAAHCDMFAALTSHLAPVGKEAQGPAEASLMPALTEGGAAFLDFLERRLRERPADFSGAVLEVF